MLSFAPGFLPSAKCFWASSIILCSISNSLSWWVVCQFHHILFIFLLINIWVFPVWSYWEQSSMNVHRWVIVHVGFHFFRVITCRDGTAGPTWYLFNFMKNWQTHPKWLCHVRFLWAMYEYRNCSVFLPTLGIVHLNFSYSTIYVTVSHCSFNLHFPGD